MQRKTAQAYTVDVSVRALCKKALRNRAGFIVDDHSFSTVQELFIKFLNTT